MSFVSRSCSSSSNFTCAIMSATYVLGAFRLTSTLLTDICTSFTPSDVVDMSKEKDWASSIGQLIQVILEPSSFTGASNGQA